MRPAMHCAVWDKSKEPANGVHIPVFKKKERIALSDPIHPLPSLRTSTDHIRVVTKILNTKQCTEESVYSNGRDERVSEEHKGTKPNQQEMSC